MDARTAGYLSGAFDARGATSIFLQHAGPKESWRGSIQIDCRAPSEVLRHYFGEPKQSLGYQVPVLRYRTTNGLQGLTIVKGIIAAVPEAARLNELLIMQHFWLCESPQEQAKVATKMRTFRATGTVPGA